jgi:myo-inositol-1(or 4)-monophosphatase
MATTTPANPEYLARVLDVASHAARSAGALMQKRIGAPVLKAKDNEADLCTAIDIACEQLISATFKRHFPAHELLGEESVAPGRVESAKAVATAMQHEWLWVVDPIE